MFSDIIATLYLLYMFSDVRNNNQNDHEVKLFVEGVISLISAGSHIIAVHDSNHVNSEYVTTIWMYPFLTTAGSI